MAKPAGKAATARTYSRSISKATPAPKTDASGKIEQVHWRAALEGSSGKRWQKYVKVLVRYYKHLQALCRASSSKTLFDDHRVHTKKTASITQEPQLEQRRALANSKSYQTNTARGHWFMYNCFCLTLSWQQATNYHLHYHLVESQEWNIMNQPRSGNVSCLTISDNRPTCCTLSTHPYRPWTCTKPEMHCQLWVAKWCQPPYEARQAVIRCDNRSSASCPKPIDLINEKCPEKNAIPIVAITLHSSHELPGAPGSVVLIHLYGERREWKRESEQGKESRRESHTILSLLLPKN